MSATEFNDIWAALFKLRDAITDTENKLTALTNQRGAGAEPIPPPPGPATGQGGGSTSAFSGQTTMTRTTEAVSAVPRNLSGERPVESLEPAFVRRNVAYYNGGPCATCGEIAYVPFVPRPDGGALSCMKCYAKEMGARR